MIEPEMATTTREDNANLAEEFIRYIIRATRWTNNKEDLEVPGATVSRRRKACRGISAAKWA